MRLALSLLSIFLLSSAHANVYRYTDEAGNTHYTDQSGKGEAVALQHHPLSVDNAVPTSPSLSALGQNQQATEKKAEPIPSYTLDILSPADQETVRNTRDVPFTLNISPALRQSESLIVYLDGAPTTQYTQLLDVDDVPKTQDMQQASQFVLSDLDRGTHTLMVAIVDAKGSALVSSETVTFYLHQAIKRQ